MQAISAVLSAAILSLARSMDISPLYCRSIRGLTAETHTEPRSERSPRIV